MTDVAAVLLAVQRLSVLASMPVEKSELHASVGEALAWTKGNLGLSSWISETWDRMGLEVKDPIERGERLEVGTGAEPGRVEIAERGTTKEEWVDAFDRLADTFTTLGCALAAVLLLQLLVHLLWKHWINRKYYALRKQKQDQKVSTCLAGPGLRLPAPLYPVLKVPTPFALCQAVPAPRGFCSLLFLSILPTRHRQSHDVKKKVKKVKFFPFPSILR